MAEMQAAVDVPVDRIGWRDDADDVARLAAAGLAGCIIGRALYEGTLRFAECVAGPLAEARQNKRTR